MSADPTKITIEVDPQYRRMVGTTYHGNVDFDVPFISQIAENLWQGGCQDGLVLPTHINFLVSLYPWERYTINHELRGELYVRMYDDRTQPVNVEQIINLATLVNEWRRRGTVLIHCQAGLNRSSLLAAMVLMQDGMKGWEAIKLLREKRSPAVLCNPTFERFIKKYGTPE